MENRKKNREKKPKWKKIYIIVTITILLAIDIPVLVFLVALMVEAAWMTVLILAILMIIPNLICSGIAFTIYKVLDRRNDPGGWISPLIVTVIVTALLLVAFVGTDRYINRVKKSAPSVLVMEPISISGDVSIIGGD